MTNTTACLFLLVLLLLASLSAIFACQPSSDTLGGCQINTLEGSSQDPVESAMFYRNINFNDDDPIILSELRDIIALDGQMSSLKVPTGYEVVLFEGENLTAPFVVLTGEISSLFAYLFNDRAQSLIYRRKTSDESKLLPSFFNIQDFKGQETPVPYGTTILKENFYGASIRVPDGLRVTVTTLHGARFKYEVKNVFTSDTSSVPFIGDPIVSIHVEMV
jgi:hypothetical protein